MLNYPEPRLPVARYGRGLIDSLPAGLLACPAIFTQLEPWPLLADRLAGGRCHFVATMEHDEVRRQSELCRGASAVVGFGGGAALDHAKYAAWVTGLPLVLIPSILSVDAAYTKAVGVREGGRVRYVGEVYPDHLLIDYGLLQAAPSLLNRAGVGDILSIFTALWDWAEAGRRLGEHYDPAVAACSRELLDRLLAGAEELRQVSEAGLHLLSELYLGEVRLCEMVGNSRPEEGSEHYVAYAVEALTGRSFVHGQLVGLGLLVAARAQGQPTGEIGDFLARLELDCSPAGVGISEDELRRTLAGIDRYVRQEEQLLPGVFHFRGALSPSEIDDLVAAAR